MTYPCKPIRSDFTLGFIFNNIFWSLFVLEVLKTCFGAKYIVQMFEGIAIECTYPIVTTKIMYSNIRAKVSETEWLLNLFISKYPFQNQDDDLTTFIQYHLDYFWRLKAHCKKAVLSCIYCMDCIFEVNLLVRTNQCNYFEKTTTHWMLVEIVWRNMALNELLLFGQI